MPINRGTGLNTQVAEITRAILGELSLEQAAVRLGYALTRQPIGDLRKGKVGRETTSRSFAEGFWQKFCELYGDQIREAFGDCTQETVSDWFAEKCGFRVRRPVTREPVLEDIDIRQFERVRELPDGEVEIINDLLRGLLDSAFKRHGLD